MALPPINTFPFDHVLFLPFPNKLYKEKSQVHKKVQGVSCIFFLGNKKERREWLKRKYF